MNHCERQPLRALCRAALAASLLLTASCAGDGNGPSSTIDTVQLKLDFGGGVTLSSVHYTLTRQGAPGNMEGDLLVGDDPFIMPTFPTLPVGSYRIEVEGRGTDNASGCKGQAMFSVVPMTTTVVQIQLMCSGIASVSTDLNSCPTIESLSAAPAEVYVGSSVQLVSIAVDPDNGPSPLQASWAATSGTLSNLSPAGATFTCTAPGTFQVKLTINDGTPAMKCADDLSISVVCTPGGV